MQKSLEMYRSSFFNNKKYNDSCDSILVCFNILKTLRLFTFDEDAPGRLFLNRNYVYKTEGNEITIPSVQKPGGL